MGHSIGDGIIVAALAAGIVGYYYLKFRDRQRRMELVHAERLAAMDKGIPLPELPHEAPRAERPEDPRVTLLIGIVLAMFAVGAMIALAVGDGTRYAWPAPLPVAFLGGGLVLYYFLAGRPDGPGSSPTRGD